VDAERSPRLAGRKVLVVDDTPANIDLLLTILEPQGLNILVATSGEAALQVAQRAVPDLILLDVMMPGWDGFETCRRMKTDPKLAEVPVIFVTARDDTSDIVTAFDIGAVDYITKPYQPEEVLARVRSHILVKALTDELQAKAHEAETLLHILCHDLQNSIGAAQGYLALARSSGPGDDVTRYLGECGVTVDRALEIIAHVRELRALATGKRTLFLRPVALVDCFMAMESVFALKLAEKELRLEYPIGPQADLRVQVDEVSFINCVLNNIVSNAIKFSRAGSTIRFTIQDKGDLVRVSLHDQGIGMSPELLVNLFRTDQPTSRPGTSGELGTGFGMPLVKHYVEMFGGTVAVESRDEDAAPERHGTTVHLDLPKGRKEALAA
jgi:two-component system, sensor histidine kinase and response regulator